jgi:putative membrane protein
MYQAQDWLDVLLKRVNLHFEQNKTGAANANKPGQQMSNSLLVPSVTPEESVALMLDAMPNQRLSEQVFAPISKRLILKNTMLFAMPLCGIIFGLIAKNGTVGIVMSAGILAVFFAIVTLRWWRWGYSFDDEFIYIRKGFLGVNYYCFPIHKVQQAEFKQNIFIKPYKLASLRMILASGAQTIPYMPEDVVRHQINHALDKLVSDKRSWM